MTLYDIHTHKRVIEKHAVSIVNINSFDLIDNQITNHYYSCGIHPWETVATEDKLQLKLEQLYKIVYHEQVICIGEAGLDRLKGGSIRFQKELFEAQIRLSEACCKPLLIHNVKATDDLIALHKKYRPIQPWIIHGYRGRPEQTQQVLKLGFLFSIGEKFNADSLQQIPIESLFCETDDAPISIRQVYKNIAKQKKLGIAALTEIIEQNVIKIFNIIKI